VNLNPERIGRLLDLFGSSDSFSEAARDAEQTGRRELARVSDLDARCEAAREQGLRALNGNGAQAQARRAAGRILTDTESYLTDVQATQALIDGLTRPIVKLVSVTCLVRGNLMAASSAS
jgi:ATP-dependent helicase HepA